MMDNSFHNSEDNDFLKELEIGREIPIIERAHRSPLVEKTLTVLEYFKIELAQILPQIEDAAKIANQKHKKEEKRLAKAKKKLLKII
jgi:hypothetical protein